MKIDSCSELMQMTIKEEEMMKEFKQYLKKIRLDEKEKNIEAKASMVRKQIKKLLGDEEIKKRKTKGDKKAKRRYNRYRRGGPKGQRKHTK